MVRRRAVLIVNPVARGAPHAGTPAVLDPLRARWELDVVTPTDADATTQAGRDAARDGAEVVFAGGGDGTAAAVARGLTGTTTALGVLPLGTANDLARALRIPRTPAAAAAHVARARVRPMDLVGVGGQHFCTVGGLGIVSDSAITAGRLKSGAGVVRRVARALGGSIYRLTATGALFSRQPLAERIEIDLVTPRGESQSIALDSPGLFVANQRFLGGGLALPGVGSDADGAFELLLIRDVSRARLVEAFTRLTLGAPIPTSVLSVHPARSARIRCARDETFLGDGDALGTAREFDVRAVPGALAVLY